MYYARNRKRKHELGEIFLLPPSRNMRRRIVLAFPDHSQFHWKDSEELCKELSSTQQVVDRWHPCICNIAYKIGYFNTKFIFLSYKNINRKINRWKKKHKPFFFGAGFNSVHVAGLNPAGIAWSLAQASDPAGFYLQACVNNSRTLATTTM